jgi:phospholipase C
MRAKIKAAAIRSRARKRSWLTGRATKAIRYSPVSIGPRSLRCSTARTFRGISIKPEPSWVASIVDALGAGSYWNSTAVIVIWDDWGGWFDHVKPTIYNSYEVGMRVPMIVVSPYAKPGYVSHVNYEFGSILKFVEETFGLGSLGTTDVRANDLSDCFNFGSRARHFTRIPAKYPASYFLRQPASDRAPPDD